MEESEEEPKSLWMKVKEESQKVGLNLNIQKTKVIASGPITSWQIDGETVADFIFWIPKSLQMVIVAMKLKDAYSLEGKGMTGDEMVGWHHQLSGHGFGWTLGVGDGQEGLACCNSWGHKESNMTEQLN